MTMVHGSLAKKGEHLLEREWAIDGVSPTLFPLLNIKKFLTLGRECKAESYFIT